MKPVNMPVDRIGWHNYYAMRFNKTKTTQAEHLAYWYLFLHLAFDKKDKS